MCDGDHAVAPPNARPVLRSSSVRGLVRRAAAHGARCGRHDCRAFRYPFDTSIAPLNNPFMVSSRFNSGRGTRSQRPWPSTTWRCFRVIGSVTGRSIGKEPWSFETTATWTTYARACAKPGCRNDVTSMCMAGRCTSALALSCGVGASGIGPESKPKLTSPNRWACRNSPCEVSTKPRLGT